MVAGKCSALRRSRAGLRALKPHWEAWDLLLRNYDLNVRGIKQNNEKNSKPGNSCFPAARGMSAMPILPPLPQFSPLSHYFVLYSSLYFHITAAPHLHTPPLPHQHLLHHTHPSSPRFHGRHTLVHTPLLIHRLRIAYTHELTRLRTTLKRPH